MNASKLVVVALTAAATSLASPALAQQPQGSESMRIGASIGTESAHPYRGVGLRVDLELPGDVLGRKGGYAWVVSGGYAHMGRTITDTWFDEQEKWRVDVFKIVPAFRLFVDPTPRLRFHADVGVGIYMATYSYEWTSPTIYPYERANEFDDTSALLRFALGGSFAVKPGFSLGGELGSTSYLGDLSDSTFNGLVTAMWKL